MASTPSRPIITVSCAAKRVLSHERAAQPCRREAPAKPDDAKSILTGSVAISSLKEILAFVPSGYRQCRPDLI